MYENWTDVSGFLVTDPRVVKDPEVIETITYRELRELAYMLSLIHIFFALFPFFPVLGISTTKDTVFGCLFLMTLSLIHICKSDPGCEETRISAPVGK